MYTFKIRSIEKPSARINGLEYSLDFPSELLSATPRIDLNLVGWISSKYAPITHIALTWRGKLVAGAKMYPRPDLGSIYVGCSNVGFQIDVVPLALGVSEPLKLVATSNEGRTTTLCELYLEFQTDADTSDMRDVAIAPVIALARSGTTYLCKLLYDNKMVLGYDNYPYEAHIAEQLAKRWFEDMQPTSLEPSWNKGSSNIDPTTHALLEFYRENSDAHLAVIEKHLRDTSHLHYKMIVGYYRWLSPDSNSSTILEKVSLSYELEFLRCIFSKVRPIFLLRDPRDIIVSMRSFNENCAMYDFDESHSKDFVTFVSKVGSALRELTWRLDHCSEKKLIVRYEDLVREPQTVLDRISTLLDMGSSQTPHTLTPAADSSTTQKHATSASPASSIGRWRQTLTQNEQEAANWYFQPFLTRFGYEFA